MTRSKRKRNPSAEYWRERETEAIRHRIKDEQEYFKEVRRIFDNASVNIDKEIKAFYMRYASKEGITLAEAKKRASQMDIEAFSNKAKRYVKTKDFSNQANEELRLYNLTMKINRLELLKANIGLDLVDAYQDLEDITRKAMTERTREELKRQSGILGESINDSRKAVEDIIGQSFYNATFSDRIWHNQTLLKSQLDTLISTGLIQGRNPKALAGELQKVFGTSRYNAERLLITELARVQTQSQQNAYEQCGYDEYQFITIGAGACPICKPMNGKTFKVRDMLVGENAPPLHPNCRCSTSAAMPAYEAWVDSGAAKNGVMFDDFKSLFTAGKGKIAYDDNYKINGKENKAEIEAAKWLSRVFGGDITLLTNYYDKICPDYLWNGRLWDLKSPKTTKGIDKLVQHGLRQIALFPGGVLVDCSHIGIDTNEAINIAFHRLERSGKDKNTKIIIKNGEEVFAILRPQ